MREALDLCLSCKACKTECPVNVDIATYKSEFLSHYYEDRRHPLRDYLFGFMDRWASMASAVPGITPRLANLPMQTPGLRDLIKSIAGVAPARTLPAFAPRSFQSGLPRRNDTSSAALPPVLLWPDTWNNYFHPSSLTAAQSVLTSAGFRVETPREHICCGRPLYDFGFLKEARRYLETILHRLAPQIDAGDALRHSGAQLRQRLPR